MDIRNLKDKTLADLREIAKAMQIKGVSKLKKDDLIDAIVNGNASAKEIEQNETKAVVGTKKVTKTEEVQKPTEEKIEKKEKNHKPL